MFRSLRWRMLLSSLVLVAAITIATSVVLGGRAHGQAADELDARTAAQAHGLAATARGVIEGRLGLDRLDAASAAVLGAGETVTVVDTAGDVRYASDQVGLTTGDALEIQAAFDGGTERMNRNDPVTGERRLHVAAPVADGGIVIGVVRVTVGKESLGEAYWGAVRPVVIVGAAALAALVVFSLLFTGNLQRALGAFTDVARRLAAGQLYERAETPHISEADPLAVAINEMATALENQVQTSYHERDTFGAVIDGMTDALLMVDEAGTVAVANPAALAVFGVSASEAIGQRLMQVVRDHEVASLVTAALAEGRHRSAQISYGHDLRLLEVSATPMERRGGAAVLVIARDLSELRRLESVRREFVANVSHELRTPLASIKASVETLQAAASDDPAAAAEFLRLINGEVDQMTTLVQELLDLATLEAGKAQFAPAPMSIAALVEAAAARVRRRAATKRIDLDVELPPGLPDVIADRDAVHGVMQNLFDNALKFTPADGIVKVRARAAEDAVEVSVTDSGAGILPEHLPHVFERFYKADTSRASSGTGLGLALAKHTIQALGGSIRAESDPGEGATFRFTLPISNGPDAPPSGA